MEKPSRVPEVILSHASEHFSGFVMIGFDALTGECLTLCNYANELERAALAYKVEEIRGEMAAPTPVDVRSGAVSYPDEGEDDEN